MAKSRGKCPNEIDGLTTLAAKETCYSKVYYRSKLIQGIIEGDQIEVAAFCLESFAYLTGLVTANHNAGSNSARARRLIQIEPCSLPIGYV